MEMESTPQEKTEYELARDRRVVEVQKRMAPVVAALQDWVVGGGARRLRKRSPGRSAFRRSPPATKHSLCVEVEGGSILEGKRHLRLLGGSRLESGVRRRVQCRAHAQHLRRRRIPMTRTLPQYALGNEVFLMNPRAIRHKAAIRKISGMPRKHKFHFQDIPENWLKIDVHETLIPRVKLMFPSRDDEQDKIEDVKGTATLWDQKYLKAVA